MQKVQALTHEQENAAVMEMLDEGLTTEQAKAVIERLRRLLTAPPGPRNVVVTQQASVVERGATMIGYRAERIG